MGLLTGTERIRTFKDALTTDPQLRVDVEREPEYYAAQSKQLTQLITVVGNTVAVIMAIGAMFGALNSMYSAVDARALEIATLRAIGFGALPVLLSVMMEALALSLLGGILGAALAWWFFNGHTVCDPGWRVRADRVPGHRHHFADGDRSRLGVRHRGARRRVPGVAGGAGARGRGAARDISCGAKGH